MFKSCRREASGFEHTASGIYDQWNTPQVTTSELSGIHTLRINRDLLISAVLKSSRMPHQKRERQRESVKAIQSENGEQFDEQFGFRMASRSDGEHFEWQAVWIANSSSSSNGEQFEWRVVWRGWRSDDEQLDKFRAEQCRQSSDHIEQCTECTQWM